MASENVGHAMVENTCLKRLEAVSNETAQYSVNGPGAP